MRTTDPELLLRAARGGDTAILGQLLELYRNYLSLLARLQIGQRLQGKADEANKELVAAGKPTQSAEITAKRIDGAVQKYLKEVSLADQVFVKAADGKQTVAQMLKAANTNVKGFTLYVVGEGIEKKVDDFAAEVAAQVAAAKAAA